MKIGVLLGSSRPNGNSHGLIAWLISLLSPCFMEHHASLLDSSLDNIIEFAPIYPTAPMHPLGPVMDDTISAMVSSGDYLDPNVREWSKLVASCDGFLILTPQFNWGYPGDLKNAMDHLYHEWRNKPIMLMTYGGHGGGKCGIQLRQVLQGLKMKVVANEVSIALPEEYIRGDARILPGDICIDKACGEDSSGHDTPVASETARKHAFLLQYENSVLESMKSFISLLYSGEEETS